MLLFLTGLSRFLSSPCIAGYLRKLWRLCYAQKWAASVFLDAKATSVPEQENFPYSLHAHCAPKSLSVTVLDGMSGTSLALQTLKYIQSHQCFSQHRADCH